MNRTEEMQSIARHVETMLKDHGRRSNITITYDKPTDETIGQYTDWQIQYHGILTGSEYFLIWENDSPFTPEKRHLLYKKDVSADSALTAAAELMWLVSSKF
ncbi:MAG: hypothetical protein IJH25_02315 [Clostridia bacterium]|nr:hypothetical protein [Clostridia bacterium]MBQ6121521.1 hypothetical protein [Clostridia bacterium]